MSRNFELMQEANPGLAIPTIGEPRVSQAANEQRHGKAADLKFSSQDAVMRQESLKLIQSLFLSRSNGDPRVVAFAGIDSGNGCSWVCAHAAETLAGQRVGSVCLIDANLRSPVLPDFFGVTNHHGLTDALSESGPIRDFAKLVRSDNLWLLSCGSMPDGSAGLLNSETMKLRIAELRKEFDYLLVDSPPLNSCADGVGLGQLADGLVLVLEANSTRREVAGKVAENLRAAKVKIFGAVLNKRTFPIPESLYKLM